MLLYMLIIIIRKVPFIEGFEFRGVCLKVAQDRMKSFRYIYEYTFSL